MFDRAQLQEALNLISAHHALFSDATVATAVAVLAERLEALPVPAVARVNSPSPPDEQRKQVTILFATIDGFTRLAGTSHNTDRLRQIDLLWRRLDETIYSHGGIVDKHMGDVMMGIFGAPLSRENDPERAVHCGLALREIVSEFLASAQEQAEADSPTAPQGPIIRIGINTGQVSLGQVGSDAGQTAIGDAVNVASRLKESSDETGIYISQDTYRLVRSLFRVEPLGEIAVKGRQTPVTVYRVVGSRPHLIFPGTDGVEGVLVPMIGREAEMAILRKALERAAQEGRGGLITIAGDAGVGKSRLVWEFYRHLGQFPFKPVIFQGRTDQRLTQVPYSLLRDLLIRHFGIEESDRSGIIEEKIINSLAVLLPKTRLPAQNAELRDRARAIGRLVGLGLPAGFFEERTGPEVTAGREQGIATILAYFHTITHRSAVTLFLLEDIHWADEDSLSLLERVAGAAFDSPLLMIALARPALYEQRPDWPGESAVEATRLVLRPLSEADSRELVFSILRKLPQIPSALSDLIVRSAAGNPFYVEELVRVLIEDGIIVPDEGAWHLRPRELTRLRVPATLTGVLQARLDRLPEVERVTLQQAAVIGNEFWTGAVQQLNRAARDPFNEEQVAAALESLERRDMIFRPSTPAFSGSQPYLFKHAVLREVAYESVLLRDRPSYHLQAARWLETQSGDRVAEYAAPIAQHYEQAGRAADAARLYELAAARAVEQFKQGSAIEYYRKVLDMLETLPQYLDSRLTANEHLGRALQQQGRLVEALQVYRSMHDSAELDGNLLGRARAKNTQAAVFLELDDAAQAHDAAVQAERLARLTGADVELMRAQLLQAEAAGRAGNSAGAIAALTQALEGSRSLDAPRETARGLALLAALRSATVDSDEVQDAEDELLALTDDLEKRGQPEVAAYALVRLGDFKIGIGRFREAQIFLDRALLLQRAAGNLEAAAETLRLLGLAACRTGEAVLAVSYLEEAAALAEATGNRYLRLGCRLAMGEALLAHRQYPAAEATLRQIIAAAEDRQLLGSWLKLREAYGLLVDVLKRQGRGDEARLVATRYVANR